MKKLVQWLNYEYPRVSLGRARDIGPGPRTRLGFIILVLMIMGSYLFMFWLFN